MTYQDQIRATAERACAAIIDIEPVILQLCQQYETLRPCLQHWREDEIQFNLHGADMPASAAVELLRTALPNFEVSAKIYGSHSWAEAVHVINGFCVRITLFARGEA